MGGIAITCEVISNATQDFSDGVLVITIDRPDAYNSLDKNLRLGLKAAFERAQEPGMRAIILLGEPKTFYTSQDLRERTSDLRSDADIGKVVEKYNPMVAELTAVNVPVIAAIEGVAVGVGQSLMLHYDFRIAGPKASFKTAFPSIGLATDYGMSALLPRMVGDAKTRELLFFDKKVLADEALSLDLVAEVMDGPATRAHELVVQFVTGPTVALKEIKTLPRRDTLATAAAETDVQARLAVSADHKGTIAAFLEKRLPRFIGE